MTPFRPSTVVKDYAVVFAVSSKDGLPPVIVGGQAVNVWAEFYLTAEPELATYLPFTSKDLDVLGHEWEFEQIARATGAKKVPSQRKMFIPTIGVLEIQKPGSEPLKIEVLKTVYGMIAKDIVSTSVVLEWSGMKLRVIDPLSLLEAKIENAAHLPQLNRQDVKHVRMMLFVARGYLRGMVERVQRARMSGRECVVALERTVQIIGSPSAKKLGAQHGIKWLDALPVLELAASTDAKLKNFSEKRLPRLFNHE